MPRRMFPLPVRLKRNESYFGGRRRNMSKIQAREDDGARSNRKDRPTKQVSAQVVSDTSGKTLRRFVLDNISLDAKVYTDDALAYDELPNHRTVNHSVGEYVRGHVHTNGIESFWSMLKRAHKGTFHKLSPKHLNRYVQEFAGRRNMRELDTLQQMALIARKMENAQLRYKDLVA